MDKSFIEELIPTSLGVDDVEEVKRNPAKAEEVFYQRNDALEKLRISAKIINRKDEALKDLPSLTTQVSIVVLNLFGTVCVSIGTSNLGSPLNITMLVIGVAMIFVSSLLTISKQMREFLFHAIEHLQGSPKNSQTT